MKRWFLLFVALLMALAWPAGVRAATVESGEGVTIAKDRLINDDLYLAGSNVTIDGTVTGDVMVVAETVTVTGIIQGNLWVAARTVEVHGTVSGTVRVAASELTSDGAIGGDLIAFAGKVTVPGGTIGRDFWAAAGQADVSAPIGRNVHAKVETLRLDSSVGGNVDARISNDRGQDQLVLGPGANIRGSLQYTAPDELKQEAGAVVSGAVSHHLPSEKHHTFINRLQGQILWFMAAVAFLIAILLYARRAAWITASKLTKHPWRSLLGGLVFVVFAPLVLLILAVLVIGLPLAIFGAGAYVLVLYTAKIFVALLLGRVLIQRESASFWVSLGAGVLGLVFLYVLMAIPVLGPIVSLLVLIVGSGAQLLLISEVYKDLRPKYGV